MNNNYKPKYQLWNEDEFQSGSRVRAMNSIQKWMYRTLLQAAWFEEARPYLPDDDSVLWVLAGCENPEQWEKYKKPVLQMFQKERINGQKLLSQKRLLSDWEQLTNKRQVMSELGQRSASTKRERAVDDTSTTRQQEKLSKLREVKEVIDNKPSRVFKRLPELCLEILGVEAEPLDIGGGTRRTRLKNLTAVYGASGVLEAAKTFYESKAGELTRYPIQEFLKVADGLLKGIISSKPNPELDRLAADLYEKGSQSFTGSILEALGRLLGEYSSEALRGAYSEFISQMDDFQLKRAPENFVKGGAAQVILAQKRRAENEQKSRELVQNLTEQLAEQGEVEREKLREARQAEEELAENDLRETFGVR